MRPELAAITASLYPVLMLPSARKGDGRRPLQPHPCPSEEESTPLVLVGPCVLPCALPQGGVRDCAVSELEGKANRTGVGCQF